MHLSGITSKIWKIGDKIFDCARGVSVCVRNESAQVIANQRIHAPKFVARTCMEMGDATHFLFAVSIPL